MQKHIKVKQRKRGASDTEILLSLIYNLANGEGAISDIERLSEDEGRKQILGLKEVPDYGRVCEYLRKFDERNLERFYMVARIIAKKVVKAVIEDELTKRGYIPVFMDGTRIEVYGDYFESAGGARPEV